MPAWLGVILQRTGELCYIHRVNDGFEPVTADSANCHKCSLCTTECPMSLDIDKMVAAGRMEYAECILCGTSVDVCPIKAIHYSFSSGR